MTSKEKTRPGSKKREDVLKATLKLTIEHGLQGTSTAAIAEEANVGMGTIYRHFENKEVLYSTLFKELTGKFMNTVASNYNFSIDPHSNFKNIVYVIVTYYMEHEAEFRFLERYSDASLKMDQRLYESTKLIEPVKLMMNKIDHGLKFKPLPPLVLFAMTYGPLVAIVNLIHMKKIEISDELIYEIADAIWDSILDKS